MFDEKWQNGQNYQVKYKATVKKVSYKAIKMFMKKTDILNSCQLRANKNLKFKSIRSKIVLDESKPISFPQLVDAANLREEFLSQTPFLLSKTLDIASIMKESRKLPTQKEQNAMAALLSTNLSFKLAEEIPVVAKVKDATFDIDNISVSGFIVKEKVLDNFNKSIPEKLKLSSLELTNTLGVNMFLSYLMSLFEEGFKEVYDGSFDQLISHKCHINANKLISNPRNFTHMKIEKKKYQITEIPSEGIFGSNICRIAVGYDSKEKGKNICLFNYFHFIILLFIIILPYNIRCPTIRCERQFMDINQIGCEVFKN
jgi:hypothetical protein